MNSLGDKEYRDLYVSEILTSTLAAQIRQTRESRGLTQGELGRLAGMAQESILTLENPDYGRYTISTLKRLASALDVALIVRLATFGELAEWVADLTPEQLAPTTYEMQA